MINKIRYWFWDRKDLVTHLDDKDIYIQGLELEIYNLRICNKYLEEVGKHLNTKLKTSISKDDVYGNENEISLKRIIKSRDKLIDQLMHDNELYIKQYTKLKEKHDK